MKIEGKFIKTLPTVEGETARGTWMRGGFVIETIGDYPRKIAFTLFGEDKVKMCDGIADGTPVEVSFMPESREFNDKWYTDLKASKVLKMTAAAPATAPQAAPAPQSQYPYAAPAQPQAEPVQQTMEMPANPDDDLPF